MVSVFVRSPVHINWRCRLETSMVRERQKKFLNIAHRGARSLAPENTLIAGKKAYEAGADMWEFDVQLTADRELVVVHDRTLNRTTNAEEVFPDRTNYRVDSFDLTEIKQLDAGSWFEAEDPFGEINRGNVSPAELQDFLGMKIPSLSEVLKLIKDLGWKANVELKPLEGPAATVENLASVMLRELLRLIKSLDMVDDVLVSSFDHSMVRELRKLNPDLTGALLQKEAIARPVEYLDANDVKILNLSASALETDRGFNNIREVDRAGEEYGVNVWTVNDPGKMKEAVSNKYLDGLITDYPARLSGIIAGQR